MDLFQPCRRAVPFDATDSSFLLSQDTHARSSALSWVENHEETIGKTRKELDRLETKLVGEEREFEEIRDGLKGSFPVSLLFAFLLRHLDD